MTSETNNCLKILFIGDIVGRTGRSILKDNVAALRKSHQADLVIVNCENAAGGFGLDRKTFGEVFRPEVDILTSGNHIWGRKEALALLEEKPESLLRPANFPVGTPGRGFAVLEVKGLSVGVVNLQGRVFMSDTPECPFRCLDHLLETELAACHLVFVDFHAETTSEKSALANYFDGRVAAICGTHTHVATADERILPDGTAFITDVGMTGPADLSLIHI